MLKVHFTPCVCGSTVTEIGWEMISDGDVTEVYYTVKCADCARQIRIRLSVTPGDGFTDARHGLSEAMRLWNRGPSGHG